VAAQGIAIHDGNTRADADAAFRALHASDDVIEGQRGHVVAEDRQGAGIGSYLMKAVSLIARDQAQRSGCAFVVVDAKSGADLWRPNLEKLPRRRVATSTFVLLGCARDGAGDPARRALDVARC
jgi:hypothetical protein